MTDDLAAWVLAVDQLTKDSSDEAWAEATAQLDDILRLLQASAPVLGKVKKWQRELVTAGGRLQQCINPNQMPSDEGLAELDLAQAFAAGREFQQELNDVNRKRAKFLSAWPRLRAEIVSGAPDKKGLRFAISVPPQISGGSEPSAMQLPAGESADG